VEIFAQILILAWMPVVLLLFAALPPRRAVIVAFLAGFLFLPMVSYKLPLLPDYTKMTATCAGILIGAVCFDSKRILAFSPRLVDLPLVLFCIAPLAASLANGLGLWDGFSGVLKNTITWGFPYLIGRVYFKDLDALKELAVGIFLGGVIYIPFCLFEMRMSPQLHNMLYGFSPREVQMRYDGWRPAVFLDGGLQLGLWMTISSMTGLWLWWTGAMKRCAGVPAAWLVWPLLLTTVLCRATGALLLELIAFGVLWLTRVTGTRLALVGLLMFAPAYITVRTLGVWHGEPITSMAKAIDPIRAESFEFRLKNEDLLVAKAMQRPIFGWGGWGRSRVMNDEGKDISITDGFWVIEFGAHGVLALVSVYVYMLLPLWTTLGRASARHLNTRQMAPLIVLGVATALYPIDCLLNSMVNPVFILTGGAVASVALHRRRVSPVVADGEADTPVGIDADCVPRRRLFPHCT
jgi:hypothetical protein